MRWLLITLLLPGAADMARQLRQARPDIPERAIAVLHQEVLQLFEQRIDGLLERVVPVYEKHFSPREIEDLLAFYRTPTGRKAVAVCLQS